MTLNPRFRVASLGWRHSATSSPYLGRSRYIVDKMVGQDVFVHNGRLWVRVRVTSDRVGFRAGEFASTVKWWSPSGVAHKVKTKGGKPATKGRGPTK